MATYNPKTIDQVASALIVAANVLLVGFILLGALLGALAGANASEDGALALPFALVATVVFGAIAYPLATLLKAVAQLLLCQVEIEANTRAGRPTPESDGRRQTARSAVTAPPQSCPQCHGTLLPDGTCPTGCASRCGDCGAAIPITSQYCIDCSLKHARAQG